MATGELKRIGQYEVREVIGRGGMATVYRAYQPNLNREVAIKVVLEQYADNPNFMERFRIEARSIAGLDHPNILAIYDFGQENNVPYIVTQLVPGGTLRDRLGLPLDLRLSAKIITQLANALEYAHERGFVHRDVKPANVLMDKRDRAILSDFGIAKLMQENTAHLTATGTGIGTPEYMSPEQGMGDPVDGRSDQYSLGVVLYEMLTGVKPFRADTPIATVMGHVSRPLPDPLMYNNQLTPQIVAVLTTALAKSPQDRFANMIEFGEAFEDSVNSTLGPSRPSGPVTLPTWPGNKSDTGPLTPPPPRPATGPTTDPTRRMDSGQKADVYRPITPPPQPVRPVTPSPPMPRNEVVRPVTPPPMPRNEQTHLATPPSGSRPPMPGPPPPHGSYSPPPSGPYPPATRQPEERKKGGLWLPLGIGGAVLVALLVVGLLVLLPKDSSTVTPTPQAANLPTPTVTVNIVPTTAPVIATTVAPTTAPVVVTTAAPSATPAPSATSTNTPAPTATPAPTVTPTPPPLVVYGSGTARRGDVDPVTAADATSEFDTGAEIFGFFNVENAQVNVDELEVTLIANGAAQPPLKVKLSKPKGFQTFSFGKKEPGDYKFEVRYNGNLVGNQPEFKVVAAPTQPPVVQTTRPPVNNTTQAPPPNTTKPPVNTPPPPKPTVCQVGC